MGDGTLTAPIGADGLCVGVEDKDPAGGTVSSTLQAWAKPLEGKDGVAVLLINPGSKQHDFVVPLSALPLTGNGHNLTAAAVHVRDIWSRAAKPSLPASASSLSVTVGDMDSVFLRLSQ